MCTLLDDRILSKPLPPAFAAVGQECPQCGGYVGPEALDAQVFRRRKSGLTWYCRVRLDCPHCLAHRVQRFVHVSGIWTPLRRRSAA